MLAALEEFAIEASVLKVAGSEMLDFAVDENVQIHGGNGFVRDYPAERHYRDARVNRIFEGTNEINRLLIPGMLVRRALKGTLPLIAAARNIQDEILAPAPPDLLPDAALAAERRTVSAMKKVALVVLGTALQTYGEKLTDEQEVLTLSADIIIDVFAAESVLLRSSAAAVSRSTSGRHKYSFTTPPAASRSLPARRSARWRRRHAADAARRPAPPAQDFAGQYRGGTARDRRRRSRSPWIHLLIDSLA